MKVRNAAGARIARPSGANKNPAGPFGPAGCNLGNLAAPAKGGGANMIWCPDRESPEVSILRKEVIQPQVPLRLPCYDLVPIKSFAFGTLTRLRALLSFVA